MAIDYRILDDRKDIDEAFGVFVRAMVGFPLRDVDTTDLVEQGRYFGAFDAGRLVGGADSFTSWLTVPGGGRVPHAAVTHVGVLPSHTRQGIVTELLTRQLRDAAARGEVVASLRASEGAIYERFGYGIASSATSISVTPLAARPRAGIGEAGEVRLADDVDRIGVLAPLYDRASWTGSIRRPEQWWHAQEKFSKLDPAPRYTVIHSSGGQDDGFAVYQPLNSADWWSSDHRSIKVIDFVAHTDAAFRGLVGHLVALDLADTIVFDPIALDSPLGTLFHNERAVKRGPVRDETWLRIIDVAAALAARRFRDAEPVVIEVHDRQIEDNNRRYEVTSKGAVPTTEPADLTLDVAALGTVYLGGTKWWQLARGGRVIEHAPGAVARADELFATHVLPFAGTSF